MAVLSRLQLGPDGKGARGARPLHTHVHSLLFNTFSTYLSFLCPTPLPLIPSLTLIPFISSFELYLAVSERDLCSPFLSPFLSSLSSFILPSA